MQSFAKLMTAAAVLTLAVSGSPANQYFSSSSSGNSFSSGGSSSVIQTGNNQIIVTRRMNANNQPDDFISVAIPKIRIDDDYCKAKALLHFHGFA